MSDIRVYPARPQGRVAAPPSKSAAHRALICAALSGESASVFPVSGSQDMEATLRVLGAMGARYTRDGAYVLFNGSAWTSRPALLNCGESGSTLRFLLPVAAALGLEATFTGEGRLPERPIGVLASQMKAHGVRFSGDSMPFTITDTLECGRYLLPGNVSSQFVSGLLFALPLLDGASELLIDGPLQSAGYVDLTIAAMARAGVTVERTPEGYAIQGFQSYRGGAKTVEGDYSNAAFWLSAGAVGGGLSVEGLDAESMQGDRAITELLSRFGAALSISPATSDGAQNVSVQAAPLRGFRIDAAPIPDLVPVLAVVAAFAQGDTELFNAARLRIKESDRISSVAAMLRALGGDVDEYPDRLVIHGGRRLRGGEVDGVNDHRIVMSAAVAALNCEAPVVIRGAHAVDKSYPNFFEDLEQLGGRYDVI